VDDVPDKGSEDLSKVEGERDELKQQVKELEKKLEDLKTKNNVTVPCV
jgi:phage shock protein A